MKRNWGPTSNKKLLVTIGVPVTGLGFIHQWPSIHLDELADVLWRNLTDRERDTERERENQDTANHNCRSKAIATPQHVSCLNLFEMSKENYCNSGASGAVGRLHQLHLQQG